MGASCKGTVKLSDGREITVDVSTLKNREYRNFMLGIWTLKDEDALITRLTGVSADDLGEMLREDFRRIFDKIVELANRPLDDPKNSPSAST